MAQELYFELPVGKYNYALTEYAKRSSRGGEEILKQQAKLIGEKAINLTPPGKEGVSGLAARRLGDKSVEASLNMLFRPEMKGGKSPAQRAEIDANTAAMNQIHQQHRNRRGRVSRSLGKNKYKVWKTDFTRYQRETKKRVGKLAHGWASAAGKLGVKLPAWIARHTGERDGSIRISVTDTEIAVTMKNDVEYASDIRGIQNRLDRAVRLQESALIRQLNNLLGDDSPFRRV